MNRASSRTALGGAASLLLAGAVAAVALATPRSTAAVARVAEFVADCPYSHRAPDDPIVFFRRPGASHKHDFFGNRTTRAASTTASLRRAGSTCTPRPDRSAYWVPTLYERGHPLRATRGTFYYLVDNRQASAVRPYPLGLRVVAGYAQGRRPGQPVVAEWSCRGSGIPSSEWVLECPRGSLLEANVRFPDCWDGRRVDSADHRSHMAYSRARRCPPSHPVAVSQLKFKLTYPTRGGPGVTLSSGEGDTLHGDFFNAWDPRALASRIRTCLHRVVKCGADGRPLS
jgi:Domain of unknown function (DUF1996)